MSNLPFLLLILLIIAVAPAADITPTAFTPIEGLFWGILAFLLTLMFIALQSFFFKSSRPRSYSQAQKLANIALLFFMILFCFAFKSIRIVEASATLSTLLPLSLYFFGLVFFYTLTPPARSSVRSEVYFLTPFALPLLCLNMITDASVVFDFEFGAEDYWNPNTLILTLSAILLFFGGLMLFMPYVIQILWQCEPLQGPLRHRLEAICSKANFRYRDLKTWGVMDHALTAAILGIYWRLRYILFTKCLIAEMPPECVEAILAHEIGHNKHKHLIIYPFIIGGMMLLITLLMLFFEQAFPAILNKHSIQLPDFEKQLFTNFWLVFCYIVFPLFYLRYIFGFFSRLFERQADLYIFALQVSPSAMVKSLEHIGTMTGTLRKPNWHHYSLQERINFLKAAEANRNLIANHHRFVHTVLYIYFSCFLALLCFLFYHLFSSISL